MSNSNGYETFRLKRNGTDIEFVGKLLAAVSSDPEQLGDRWTELTLYTTKGGSFVSQSIGKSVLPMEKDIYDCEVYKTVNEASEFFKRDGRTTWLSRQMFAEIHKSTPGFDVVERVD